MKWLLAFALVAIVAAGVILASKQDFGAGEHERFESTLWELKELDDAFDRNLLRARFSLLNTYDDFEENRRDLAQAIDDLRNVPPFVDAWGRAELLAARKTQIELLERRNGLTETFKTQNAVVSNSRRYLPLAIARLSEGLEADRFHSELEPRVETLALALFAFEATAYADPEPSLEHIAALENWIARHPDDARAQDAAGVARHARLLVEGATHLNTITEQMLAIPAAAGLGRMRNVYQAQVIQALVRARQYRNALYALCGLAALAAAFLFWNLRGINRRLEAHVRQRTADLEGSEKRFRTLATNAPIGIFLTDALGNGHYANPLWERLSGVFLEQDNGTAWRSAIHPKDAPVALARWDACVRDGTDFVGEFRFRAAEGAVRDVRVRSTPVRDEQGQVTAHVGTVEDVTERNRMTSELHQAQKLESVGRLAAGVAHEINTPVQFVNDSCHFLREGLGDLQSLLRVYQQTFEAVGSGEMPAAEGLLKVKGAERAADLDYLDENLPSAVERSLEGLQRVTTIVRSMKEFSHPDQRERIDADLNKAILSTLTVARNEYKYVADLNTELGDLPPVQCHVGDFNQAVLNLVINASHAIGDVVRGRDEKGLITVRTRCDGDHVVVSIEDTGGGIPPAIQDCIFDPFFTTKEIGRGTGQGLAIVRSVIVDKHQGDISFESRSGEGTTFFIRLPIRASQPISQALAA